MIKQLLEVIYPRHCWLCLDKIKPQRPNLAKSNAPLSQPMDLCPACQADLVVNPQACWQCGLPLPHASRQQRCGQCLQKPPSFDHVISPFLYQEPLSWLIQQMKFNKKSALCPLLAELFLAHYPDTPSRAIDAIIPVPLHHKRHYERGFNQAEAIAKVLAQRLQLPLQTRYLLRQQPSQAQSGLNAAQRRRNVRGIFAINKKLTHHYQHVVVVDDVMSTGSTANEIAKLLKKQGIAQVDIWVIARADSPGQ